MIQTLIDRVENIEQPQQAPPEVKAADEVKKEFKDFFEPNTKPETIETIKNDFKDLNGKKMAFLIYLLSEDFKIISYSLKGKNDSRKHFVEALNNKIMSMQGINKHFEAYSTKLNINKFETDEGYIKIREQISNTIKK